MEQADLPLIPMSTRIIIIVGVAAVVAWPIYLLGALLGLWQPWTRPPGVSATAHFVSSIEDGTWFDCEVDAIKNVNRCKAWDYQGQLVANGEFRLEGTNRAATRSELRPSSVISSGGHAYMIYLFGADGAQSRVLMPVNTSR